MPHTAGQARPSWLGFSAEGVATPDKEITSPTKRSIWPIRPSMRDTPTPSMPRRLRPGVVPPGVVSPGKQSAPRKANAGRVHRGTLVVTDCRPEPLTRWLRKPFRVSSFRCKKSVLTALHHRMKRARTALKSRFEQILLLQLLRHWNLLLINDGSDTAGRILIVHAPRNISIFKCPNKVSFVLLALRQRLQSILHSDVDIIHEQLSASCAAARGQCSEKSAQTPLHPLKQAGAQSLRLMLNCPGPAAGRRLNQSLRSRGWCGTREAFERIETLWEVQPAAALPSSSCRAGPGPPAAQERRHRRAAAKARADADRDGRKPRHTCTRAPAQAQSQTRHLGTRTHTQTMARSAHARTAFEAGLLPCPLPRAPAG